MKNKLILLTIFLFILNSSNSNAFFKKEILLNCEPNSKYFEDTRSNFKYIKFDEEEIVFNWDPVEKKFLSDNSSVVNTSEQFYQIYI